MTNYKYKIVKYLNINNYLFSTIKEDILKLDSLYNDNLTIDKKKNQYHYMMKLIRHGIYLIY